MLEEKKIAKKKSKKNEMPATASTAKKPRKKYRVLKNLSHNGKNYRHGDRIEISNETIVARLKQLGVIE